MGWKDLEYRERWNLVCSALQAAATIGTFLVALVGLWSVVPIITYQIGQQETRTSQPPQAAQKAPPQALSVPSVSEHSEMAERFVADVLSWWTVQVDNYQRIMDLVDVRNEKHLRVSFKIVRSTTVAGVPSETTDMLVFTATEPGGRTETIQVPVNAKAMPPSQYIQYRINQGAFSMLDPDRRQAVEQSVGRYIHAYMLPKVPPAYVRTEMSLKELRQAISYHQQERREATQRIRALSGIIDAALLGREAEHNP